MDERNGSTRPCVIMRRACRWAHLLALILYLTAPAVAEAQVATDITQSGLNTQINRVDNSYDITGGTRPGGGINLFHSFGNFSVGAGDTANFVNDSGLATSNIFGRVTGGNISQIYGTIRITPEFGSANLFLINPSGFVLGPSASLDVAGSVAFTTAQYIRLLDSLEFSTNAYFYANPANDVSTNSILAIDPSAFVFLPAAYGFLTTPDTNATITVQGSNLSVPSGQSISLVGGKVVIQGTQLPDGTIQEARLSAPNGSILLATSASSGEFDATALFTGPNVNDVSFTSYGFVALQAGSSIDVSGTHTVWIRGGQLVLSVNDATLNSSGTTAPQDTISLGPGSFTSTSNSETDASAPDLQLTASDIHMTVAFISSQTDGPGRGGNVNVAADRVTFDQSSSISTLTAGLGAGGNVSIQGSTDVGKVVLSGSSKIVSSTSFGGSGTGGEISISTNFLDLKGGSTLQSETFGSGPNGAIVVSAQQANLSESATIQSITAFSGENSPVGGKITVQGLEGPSKADSLVLLDGQGTGLKTVALGGGRLGDIEVTAKTVSLRDGAVIQAGSGTDVATAGSVTINADSVGLSGGSIISSHAFAFDAGPVTITATNQFTLDHSLIATNTSSPTGGSGGDIVVKAGSVSLTNGAKIDSSSSTIGNAGNISINSKAAPGKSFEMSNSQINTSAALADGGNIEIYFTDRIRMTDSAITSSVGNETITTTKGGNITIDPAYFIMQRSGIRANAFAGEGGNIDITAGLFLADSSSIVDASSTLGVSGTVQINAPINNLSSVVGRLPESLIEVQALLRAACAARMAQGGASSFVERGRDSIPAGPEGLLASPYLPVTSRPPATFGGEPVIGADGIQLRRLPGNEFPALNTILSGNTACSS